MATAEIVFDGITFDVEFDYQPEEPMVRYYSDGTGYPGCAESVDNISVFHKGTDFTDFLDGHLDRIEELILESIHEGYDY